MNAIRRLFGTGGCTGAEEASRPARSAAAFGNVSLEEPAMDAKPEVLVVDDDPQVRNLLDEVIKDMGAQAICVSSGRVAAELISRHKLEGVVLNWKTRDHDSLGLAR